MGAFRLTPALGRSSWARADCSARALAKVNGHRAVKRVGVAQALRARGAFSHRLRTKEAAGVKGCAPRTNRRTTCTAADLVSSSLLTGLLGVTLGMRHALEPDHLAAVSTLAAEQRTVRAGMWMGAWWGLGHSLALMLVGGTLAVLGAQLPERVALLFELLVSAMIMTLGARAVWRSVLDGRRGHPHVHLHAGVAHTHAARVEHLHLRSWTFATRPMLVGVVHGLAGSGALTALVLAELPSSSERLAYIGLFGGGSVVGMALLTGLAGVPLMRLARVPRAAAGLLAVAGALSVAVGGWWGAVSVERLRVLAVVAATDVNARAARAPLASAWRPAL